MRKQSTTGQPEKSRVRMLYVDADLGPGEIQEITSAFVAAIRPAHAVRGVTTQQRIAPAAGDGNGSGTGQAELELDEAEIVDEEREDGAPAARGPRQRRNYKKPTVIEMDLSAGAGGVAFEDFATEKSPDTHADRYLVAAAWLHDHAGLETITVNHVYTCYLAAGWNFDVTDPGWPFRELKGDGLGTTNRGNFSIGHLGLSRVKKMNAVAT